MKKEHRQQNFEEIRLDPYNFPQRITYNCLKLDNLCSCILQENKVLLYYILASNVSSLPVVFSIQDFKGVVAHIITQGDDDKSIALSLLHKDLALSIPLFISRDLKSALVNWYLWADVYNLPMYLFKNFGTLVLINDKDSFYRVEVSSGCSLLSLRMRNKDIDLQLGGKSVILQ